MMMDCSWKLINGDGGVVTTWEWREVDDVSIEYADVIVSLYEQIFKLPHLPRLDRTLGHF